MKNRMPLFKLMILFVLLFCSGELLDAQNNRYTLKITVTTATGASVSGTPVVLENGYTGVTYNKTLPENGYLEFSSILGGTYKLTIKKEGLAPYINNNLVLSADTDLPIVLQENVVTPYGLKSELSYDPQTGKGIADFTWNNDVDAFFDDFESYDDFAISFAPWTGLDLDKASPIPLDITYPHYTDPQYATIFNPAATTPSRLGYPDMMPYSGLKCIAFIRANGKPNNDWVISPKILIKDGDIVSFMAKALGINFAEEQFRVAVSVKGNTDVNDFTIISNGNNEVANATWSKFEYDLSAYAGKEIYIAINYMSIYRQMLMVDDFFVGRSPSSKIAKLKRIGAATNVTYPQYQVYLDGQLQATQNETGYQVRNISAGAHTLGVKAVYQTIETALQTTSINVDSEDSFASVSAHITTNNGASADGLSVYLTNKDANIIYNETVNNGAISIPYARKGNYELSIQAQNYKTYGKTFTLTEAQSFDIQLEEMIVKPYNLTVDVAKNNGAYDATFVWNQELGWRDGFESYPDFTQNPTPWTGYDLDKVVSYTIGWGFNQGEQYQFPGTGEATGPIIFNPSTTVPAMTADAAAVAPEGKKYVAFFSAQMSKSNDWLISPPQEIKKDYVLRFMLKSYPALGISDQINISISETNDVKTFTVLDAITPSNENWVLYELPLSDYDGKTVYIGFNYVSYDGFFVQLDDVYVGPSTTNVEMGNVEKYEVYLDGVYKQDLASNSFKFEGLAPNKTYVAGVKSVYKSGISEISELEFSTQAQNSIDETRGSSFKVYPTVVTDGRFVIESDAIITDIQIFDMAGQLVKNEIVNNQNKIDVKISNLSGGLYTVKIATDKGNKIAKIIVK